MDKPASPERGPSQLVDDIQKEIASSVEGSELMSADPDLSEIWHGEAFTSLSSEEQRTIIAWAQKKGWPTPDAPATQEPATEVAAVVATADAAPSQDEARAEEPVAPVPERREEKRERPKTWLFREYRLATAKDGSAIIEEDRKRRNDDTGKYDEQDIPTSIVIPSKLREMIERDSSVADELIAFCNDTRRQLDVEGVKVFIDRPKRTPGKIYAKWKYALGDAKFQDQIKLDEIPAELMDIVREDLQYYKTKNWNDWYGPAMQQKREAVISAELGKRYGDEETQSAADAPARSERKPAPAAEAAGSFIPRIEGLTEGDLRTILASRADLVAEQFERLMTLPADADKFVEHVVGFTGSLFAQDYKQGLSADKVRAVVREALLKRYAAKPDVVAAIAGAMKDGSPEADAEKAPDTETTKKESVPPAPPANTPAEPAPAPLPSAHDTIADEVIDVQDEWIESDEPAATERTPAPEAPVKTESGPTEKEVAESYAELRADMERLSTVGQLDGYVERLEKMARSEGTASATGAKRLLSAIDAGLAGPLSEQRLTDFVRPDEEAKFFKAHPSLEGRNFRVNEEGKVAALVDPSDEEGSLQRAMRRIVDDAFAAEGINDTEVAERIAAFTVGIVTGRNKNAQMRKTFTEKLAALNEKKDELTVENLAELGLTLAGLAEQLQKAKKG